METKTKARQSTRLLILNRHGSHITMAFIEYCDAHKIHLAILPPHSTHTLQPLNVGLFKPLASAYSNELSNFLYRSQGITGITKRDFFKLFYKAWDDSITPANTLSAFKKCGISPFNPDQVLGRFRAKSEERPSSSSSSSSVLSASD